MSTPTRHLRDERGLSMFVVIVAMLVTAMFVAASFAAANGDLPMSGDSRDRKATFAAAEAGQNFYSFHLGQDADYWIKCDAVPAPNATEPNPVNQKWNYTGADPRRWRNIAGSPAQYTVELLPAKGYTACVPGNQKSLVDLGTGTFRLRFTGRPSNTSKLRRSIVSTYRRDGFLNFLYFTDFEDLDPQAHSTSSARATAQANCADRYRAARPAGTCTEIQFVTGDKVNGPFHTNDDILVCGSPIFGRDAADRVEVSGPPLGYQANGSCGNSPVFNGPFKSGQPKLRMPSSNATLRDAATAGGRVFYGKTTIRMNGAANTMTVTTGSPATTTTIPNPANGVVYVASSGACTPEPPTAAAYTEANACGNLYVSGSYAQSMTFGAEHDIIVKPPNGSANGDVTRVGDAVLGLIANNFVRIYHRVDRTSGCVNYETGSHPLMRDVTVEAAILSVTHSLIVDNYNCGDDLGTLTVKGAIAQKYRGPVGTGSGGSIATGYYKNYTYDDRLRYRSPPFFLNPVDAAWSVIRSNEQVPAK